MTHLLKPEILKIGDTIGLISPSAPLAGLVPHRTQKGIQELERLGFRVKLGKNALKVTGHTAGTPQERAEDVNSFFADKEVKAIFSFIGGNHSNQMLKYLDFNLIRKNPKIFLGYSDATVLHLALHTRAGLATFYGPAVLVQFAENPRTILYTKKYFKKALMVSEPIGKVQPSNRWTDEILDWFKKEDLKRPRKLKKNQGWKWLRQGVAEGKILGGCITSMLHLRGTEYWPNFSGSILFWETPESEADFTKGEGVENIDSHLADLELSGVFKNIKGMIVGRFFGYSLKQKKEIIKVIQERTFDYQFPILLDVDIGHSDPMITVPLGVRARLDSLKNIFEITENGVN